MTSHERSAGVLENVRYWAKYLTLQIWGPAQLDRAHDPVEHLKEEHAEDMAERENSEDSDDRP